MIVYGHRGAKGEAPENSVAGFEQAYANGIRHFEMDILLSGDGEPVVHHDLNTERTTGHEARVSSMTVDQLQALDIRIGTRHWRSHCGIPTLSDVIETCPDFRHLQLEVKSDARSRMNVLCNRLAELIQRNAWQDRIAVTSSDTWFLHEMKRRDRHIRTGLVWDRRFPNPLRAARKLRCDYLCINSRLVTRELVEAAHRANLHVSTWTVNRIHDMLVLADKGVDSIITDYPTSALVYFEKHWRLERLRPGAPEAAGQTTPTA